MKVNRFTILSLVGLVVFIAGVMTFLHLQDSRLTIYNVKLPKQDALGQTLQLKRGNITLVNYWATWCQPCLKEMPALQALQAAHPDITVIGVNFDAMEATKIQKIAKQLNVHYYLLNAFPLKELGIGRIGVVPTTLVFDRNGELTATLTGDYNRARFEEKLRELFGGNQF